VGNFRRRVFDRAAREADLTGLTPHDLRHTAASLAVSSGANVKAVQRLLGHASAAMTLDAQDAALGTCEHQIVRRAAGDHLAQLVNQRSGDRHGTAVVGLGGAEDGGSVGLCHRFGDLQAPAQEVHPSAAQRRQLTEAQAGEGQHLHDQPVVPSRGRERLDLRVEKLTRAAEELEAAEACLWEEAGRDGQADPRVPLIVRPG
jgi:hypothetical protein